MPNTTIISTPEAIRFISARQAVIDAQAQYSAICKETSVAFQNQVLDALTAIECISAQNRLKAELVSQQGESANRLFPHNE